MIYVQHFYLKEKHQRLLNQTVEQHEAPSFTTVRLLTNLSKTNTKVNNIEDSSDLT